MTNLLTCPTYVSQHLKGLHSVAETADVVKVIPWVEELKSAGVHTDDSCVEASRPLTSEPFSLDFDPAVVLTLLEEHWLSVI